MSAKLIVANVSRLTRNPDFMAKLVSADVEVEFCDLPNVEGPTGRFMLRQMLSVAELEAGMVGERTRKALAAAKARGIKLGGDRGNLAIDNAKGREASLRVRQDRAKQRASDLAGVMRDIEAAGATSLRQIAAAFNERGIKAAQGGAWSPMQIKLLRRRIPT